MHVPLKPDCHKCHRRVIPKLQWKWSPKEAYYSLLMRCGACRATLDTNLAPESPWYRLMKKPAPPPQQLELL